MSQLRHFFNNLFIWVRRFRRSRPEDIPKKLSPEALQQAMEEAKFLFLQHGVEVRSLEAGEVPQSPRPADGSEFPAG